MRTDGNMEIHYGCAFARRDHEKGARGHSDRGYLQTALGLLAKRVWAIH